MSRSIKFRVWDKEEKRLSKPFHFWQDNIEWENDVPMPMSFARANYERFEWLQYTGLKDVNGKEIYEDYIVTNVGMLEVPFAISFIRGSWCACRKDDETGLEHGNYWEVRGTIYENTELLAEKHDEVPEPPI